MARSRPGPRRGPRSPPGPGQRAGEAVNVTAPSATVLQVSRSGPAVTSSPGVHVTVWSPTRSVARPPSTTPKAIVVPRTCAREPLPARVTEQVDPEHDTMLTASEPAEPETAEPETAELETAELETAELETAELETAEPETAEPETAELETAELETAEAVTRFVPPALPGRGALVHAAMTRASTAGVTIAAESRARRFMAHHTSTGPRPPQGSPGTCSGRGSS
jgi:hypothetical protein